MQLSKFLALYYGVSMEEGDGLDYFTINEHTLHDVCNAFMDCREHKDHLAVLVADAKRKQIISQDEVVA